MMIDWRRFRDLVRPDLSRIVSKEKLSDKDYCDLKIILSDLERSYTIQMFEEQEEANGGYISDNGVSGYRRPHGYARAYYDDMSGQYGHGQYGYSGRVAPYRQHMDQGYSGHDQSEDFKERLQEMYHTAANADTRRVIQEAMDKLR